MCDYRRDGRRGINRQRQSTTLIPLGGDVFPCDTFDAVVWLGPEIARDVVRRGYLAAQEGAKQSLNRLCSARVAAVQHRKVCLEHMAARDANSTASAAEAGASQMGGRGWGDGEGGRERGGGGPGRGRLGAGGGRLASCA
eukprot:scaffold45161_cov39-Tisochrysis_lutea.AAC.2